MMELTIVTDDGTDGDKLAEVTAKLQARFDETKQRNPAGYRDAFELRQELHLSEVAEELGADCWPMDGGGFLLNFSSHATEAVLRVV